MATTSAPPAPALEEALSEFFRAARRARGRANRRTEPNELSLAQWHLVEPLLTGPQACARLAEAADVSPPTASRMIEGLVARGHLKRIADSSDRRVVLLELTLTGRSAALAKQREVKAVHARIVGALSAEERERGAELLSRLAEIVEEL
jgi:DNA-binding MarR family transcriptional regulator